MRVEILAHTEFCLKTIHTAFKQCYSPKSATDLSFYDNAPSKAQMEKFISDTVASGHLSPIEHVSFTFAVSEVSRTLSHQLVRHRISSVSQQSQRYVAGKDFGYVTPPKIAADPEAREVYDACMSDIGEAYDRICSLFSYDKKALEDARFVLPGAAHTSIVFTMNCRSLLNFFEHRCCDRAQWEIRAMANIMLGHCKDVLPCVFKDAGAKCRKLGYCPEGKFCCGKYPTAAALSNYDEKQ